MSFWKCVGLAALFYAGLNLAPAAAAVAPPTPLVWEPTNVLYSAKAGDISAHFTFSVSNTSSSEIVVDDVKTSCGCTVAQFPTKPWHLKGGETNHMDVLVDLRGKWGRLFKQVTVFSTNEPTTINLVIDVPENQGSNAMSPEMASRIWGQQLAGIDHQAVFKKDCVSCHLVPAFGKTGEPLYQLACGICHEAKHRATMVPDLHALNSAIDKDYWRHWVTDGKEGSLMPGFAAKLGGPLDDQQINSLVNYLIKAFPRPIKSGSYDSDEGSD